jgi:hypothetical protein
MISRDDVYTFDGSSARSLTDNRIHERLLALSNDGSFAYAALNYSPNQDFVFVQVAGTARAGDVSLVYSIADDTWNETTFGSVYGYDMMALTADTDPELICLRKNDVATYQAERFTVVYDEALEAAYLFVTGSAERTGIPLERAMMIEKVLPILRGPQPLKISIGVQASQDQVVRWTPECEIDPAQKSFIPVRKVGRFVCWRARARARQPWYLEALDIRARPAGDKD